MDWCGQATSEYPGQYWPRSLCHHDFTDPQWIQFAFRQIFFTLRWRHNDHAGVSNHQPHGCLLNRLFRRNSKKTSKLRVTGLCAGNSPGIPHKWPVTRKMFPFDDVIMTNNIWFGKYVLRKGGSRYSEFPYRTEYCNIPLVSVGTLIAFTTACVEKCPMSFFITAFPVCYVFGGYEGEYMTYINL